MKSAQYTRTVLPQGCSGKESTCQCRSHRTLGFDLWVGKIPWSRKQQPTPEFLLGKFHEQRSLASYSPWGRQESDSWIYAHTQGTIQSTTWSIQSPTLYRLPSQPCRPLPSQADQVYAGRGFFSPSCRKAKEKTWIRETHSDIARGKMLQEGRVFSYFGI